MDVQRPDRSKQRRRKRIIISAAGVGALLAVTLLLAQLEPAAPSADLDTLYLSTVQRGEMLRQVRGAGSLVPENLQWLSASTAARVDRILVLPGSRVTTETVLIELSNSEVTQAALEAESELRAAQSDFVVLRANLESQILTQEAALAQVTSEHNQAELQMAADEKLAEEGLLPGLNLELSRLRAGQLASRNDIETRRLEKGRRAAEAQLEAQESRLQRLQDRLGLHKEKLASLRVTADITGVLQEVSVEEGQRVTPGTVLARVAEPGLLKAELRIPETQAKDLQIGQVALIDTRNGIAEGTLVRIDPAVRQGSVTVDVALSGELPKGARPDLSVDGTIEIERLDDTLFVGRPAYGQAHKSISLFRLDANGKEAHRVQVMLGSSSVNTVEVAEGLNEGDRVILSDTSEWDDFDRIRLD